MKEKREEAVDCSRRSILKGSAALLVGGIAGRISNAYAAPEPTYAPAPAASLEDLATLHLDVVAAQKGYTRAVPSLWTD